MDSVHPIVSDLYAAAHHQERLAEAKRIRRAKHADHVGEVGGSILARTSIRIGAGLVRIGVRLQGASTDEATPTGPVVATGSVRS